MNRIGNQYENDRNGTSCLRDRHGSKRGARKDEVRFKRSTFARVKFLSRLFTALNLLPSMATLTLSGLKRFTAQVPPLS
jgi:hypothetical protein